VDVVADVSAVSLPADFMVWLASPKAAFLKGRYVWAKRDVEEMLAMREELGESEFVDDDDGMVGRWIL